MSMLIEHLAEFIVHARYPTLVYYILDNMDKDRSSTFTLDGKKYRMMEYGGVTDAQGHHVTLTIDQIRTIINQYDSEHERMRRVMEIKYSSILTRTNMSIDQYVNWVLDITVDIDDDYDWNARYR